MKDNQTTGSETNKMQHHDEGYDVTDNESVYRFGVTQGYALFTDPDTQGDPDWPILYGDDGDVACFAVRTPQDIKDDVACRGVLNDYYRGIGRGMKDAYGDTPEGRIEEEECGVWL
jgi:hypothetical protein